MGIVCALAIWQMPGVGIIENRLIEEACLLYETCINYSRYFLLGEMLYYGGLAIYFRNGGVNGYFTISRIVCSHHV